MTNTQLYLVRHAHSTYTPDEAGRPLSPRGLAAAERVTQLLEKENIDFVVSSPYRRAIQTVEGIARDINQKVIIQEGFKERELSEKTVDNFDEAIEKVWGNPTFSWEGGESNVAAQKRGIEATVQVLEQYMGKRIVVGTHGNIMVLIMNYFNRNYDFTFWKQLAMPDIYRLTFNQKDLKEIKRIWN